MTLERLNKIGQQTALLSFLFGTTIFAAYFYTSMSELLFIGYTFIIIAGLVNIRIIISILLKTNEDKVQRKKSMKTCGIMLLNIPALLLYCWIAIILINTMRITFTNTTRMNLTNINILGCEKIHIDKLKVGESKTVWVEITGDCSINIDYLANGIQKEESVESYVTNGMGQKINHKIGKLNEEQIY
ncbi:hypothetical protein [Flavobacterium soli]|uniref:hypothetical protein n=1 Tax=Flavobacterium soli TaxID=344881 RepID=UPI0004147FE8|nr:hypothetical protein [Flavobacterium soli]